MASSAFALLVAMASPTAAQVDQSKATAVKAAYLRYIAEFTTWPAESFASADDPIVIGVIGDDRSGVVSVIQRRIESKGLNAQKRPIVVHQLSTAGLDGEAGLDSSAVEPAFAEQLGDCHLLFVSDSVVAHWPRIRGVVERRAIVTVSGIEGFASNRGMIELVVSAGDDRVAMHIDLAAVRGARLRLSSRLLGLKKGVKIVRDSAPGTSTTNGSAPG